MITNKMTNDQRNHCKHKSYMVMDAEIVDSKRYGNRCVFCLWKDDNDSAECIGNHIKSLHSVSSGKYSKIIGDQR